MLVNSQQNVKGSKSKYWYNNETMFERQEKKMKTVNWRWVKRYLHSFPKKKRIFFFEQHLKIINNSREKSLIKKHNVKIKRNNISWDLRKSIKNILAYVIHFSSVWLTICGIYLFFLSRDKQNMLWKENLSRYVSITYSYVKWKGKCIDHVRGRI